MTACRKILLDFLLILLSAAKDIRLNDSSIEHNVIMKKLILTALIGVLSLNVMAQQKILQTAGQTQLGDFAPQFAELNDKVLFGPEVWNDSTLSLHDRERFQQEMIFPIGEPNTAYAQYFVGNSYLAPLSAAQIPFSNVTFEPGCRNNWHIHKATSGGGQMLVGVAGRGWYQEEGKPAVEILPGTVIHIPANVKHWHGAAKDSWFAHLAFSVPGENTSNEWLEPVDEAAYFAL